MCMARQRGLRSLAIKASTALSRSNASVLCRRSCSRSSARRIQTSSGPGPPTGRALCDTVMSGIPGGGGVGELILCSIFFNNSPEQFAVAYTLALGIGDLVDPPATMAIITSIRHTSPTKTTR